MTDANIHRQVTDVIQWFYTNIRGYKPDSKEYAKEYKRTKAIMFPEDDNLRGYSKDEVIEALTEMRDNGIVMFSLDVLYFPHLLPAMLGTDAVFRRHLIQRVRLLQREQGLSPRNEDKPIGW